MSSTFDSLSRIFRQRFEPKSGNEYEKHLFEMVIEEMHSHSHDTGDSLNRGKIAKAVRKLDTFCQGKRVEVMATGHTLSIRDIDSHEFVLTVDADEDCQRKVLAYLRRHNCKIPDSNRVNYPWLKDF